MIHHLQSVAATLVADGKGILAADETIPTLTKRFDALGIKSTEQSRRTYREMLFTPPGVAEFVSGSSCMTRPFARRAPVGCHSQTSFRARASFQASRSTPAKPLAGFPNESVTEGLDGLRDRLTAYHEIGARFAKWRAVIRISDSLPSHACMNANAHALARYAALCQEQRLVSIVEPEVLMDGTHTLERCEEVTGKVLRAVFTALSDQSVSLESMLLKPSMVIAGKECPRRASVEEVATATLRCLRRHVPAAVPGIVFLSGGQEDRLRTSTPSTGCPGPSPGKSASPMGALSRIRRWRRGTDGRRA